MRTYGLSPKHVSHSSGKSLDSSDVPSFAIADARDDDAAGGEPEQRPLLWADNSTLARQARRGKEFR